MAVAFLVRQDSRKGERIVRQKDANLRSSEYGTFDVENGS